MLSTCACSFTRTPPNVNVIPPVTGHAVKGGVSSRCAQFDFGSARPSVASPSLTVAIEGAVPTAALYASSVSRQPAWSTGSCATSVAERVGDDRLPGLVAPLQQVRDLRSKIW